VVGGMGYAASWDAMLFYPLARGWMPVAYDEPNQTVAIIEFIGLVLIAVLLLVMWMYWSKNIWRDR